ncbi:hypothetical protein Tco_0150305 [Tanacetum coccineum]
MLGPQIGTSNRIISTASTSVSTGSRVSTVSISLDLSRLATTLNRLERSIQIGINKWYQSLLRNSEFGGNDESKKMQKYILKQQFESFSVSNSEGLHKGYDRFQSLLSQLEIHGAGISTEDANQKFLRSLPASWSQVSLIMRTKPGVAIKEVEESDRPARSVLTLKSLLKIDPKEIGKGVLEEELEPAKKLKKSNLDAAQLDMDEEVARQVNVELQAELERERVAAEEAT